MGKHVKVLNISRVPKYNVYVLKPWIQEQELYKFKLIQIVVQLILQLTQI